MLKMTSNQQKAIKTNSNNVLISAGAGSGKTTVLSERVINKLNNGVDIDDLLILTFTKAAAQEMKERIFLKIKKNKNLSKQLSKLEIANITTFDGFYLSLVKKYYYKLNISKNINIGNSFDLYLMLRDSINIVFKKYYSKLNDFPLFEELIEKYTIFDDEQLKNNFVNIYYSYLNDLKKTNITAENAFEIYYLVINSKIEYLKILKKKLQEINIDKKLIKTIANTVEKINYITSYTNYNDLVIRLEDYKTDKIKNTKIREAENIDMVKIAIKEIVDNIDDLLNFVVLKKKEKLIEEEQNKKEIKKFISVLVKDIYDEFLLKKKKSGIYDFKDIELFTLELLKDNGILYQIQNEYNEIMVDEYQDTNDFQNFFIEKIQNNNLYLVGDVKQSIYGFRNANPNNFQKLNYEFKLQKNAEVIELLDNYRSRFEILEALNNVFSKLMTEDNGGINYNDGHMLNYGNQNFTKSLESANHNQEYGLSILNYQKKEIEKEIIEYQNEIKFELPNNMKILSEKDIEPFIIAMDVNKKIEQKYQVFDIHKNEYRDCEYGDFTVLTRQKNKYNVYKKIFEYFQIDASFQNEESLNDFENYEIYVLKNIYFLIHNFKTDKEFKAEIKLAIISLLRSFLYLIHEQKIYEFLNKTNIWNKDNLINDELLEKFSQEKDIEIAINDLFIKILYLQKFKNYSVSFMFNQILKEFDIINKFNTTHFQNELHARINYLQNITLEYDESEKNNYDMYIFLINIIDEDYKIEVPIFKKQTQMLKVMTIHKSKGLEFPIVYMAGLTVSITNNRSDLINYYNDYGIDIPKISIYEKEESFLSKIQKNDTTIKELHESVRLLYVGVTRAKEKLYILNNQNNQNSVIKQFENLKKISDIIDYTLNKVNSYSDKVLFDSEKYLKYVKYKYNIQTDKKTTQFQEKNKDENVIKINKKIEQLYNLHPKLKEVREEIKYEQQKKLKLIDKKEKKLLDSGTELHDYFEIFNFDLLKEIKNDMLNIKKKKIKKYLLKNGVYELDDMYLELTSILVNMSEHSIFTDFTKYFNEYEYIIFENDSPLIGRIDLLLEYSDKFIIVDYKIDNIYDIKYQQQLRKYQKFITSITNKNVEACLYSLRQNKFEKLYE